VSKASTFKKLGVAARVAQDHVGRNRTASAVFGAVRTTARSFGRVLHQLWLEVTGVIFLLMALSFAAGAVREYGKYHAGQSGPGPFAIAACVALTFAWFGMSSFWRSRRKMQRP
jgi:hypothetical protein